MKEQNRVISVGLFTAIAASLCCITPVLALIAGSSGIVSTFSLIEPFRPFLIGFSILLLGFAWYQKLKPQKTDECGCETNTKPKFIHSKSFLGLITIFAAVMIAFPYYSGMFYPKNEKEIIIVDKATIREVEVKIKGMTCAACEEHVKHEVDKLAGIISAEISYANRNAIIKFDTSKTNAKAIEEAVKATGYKVTGLKLK